MTNDSRHHRPVPPDCDAERRILLACALTPAGVDLSPALLRACGNLLSWGHLLTSATENRLRPQLASRIQALLPRFSGADRGMIELAQLARPLSGRGMFMAGELLRVLDTLRTADILAVPFKGPAFATLLGAGPGSREMADLDVLVRPVDVVRAAKALAPLGYAPVLPPHALASPWLTRVTSELPLLGQRDSMLLELHWRLSHHWYPAPCTIEDVMARLTERDFFGCRIRWPAAEELLLVHVADGMKSCGCGIRWIADVVQVLRNHADLDWHHVRRIATRAGGVNSVRVALAVADEVTRDVARGMDIPALALALPVPAQALADEARRVHRLADAVQSIRLRLQSDTWITSAMAHFRWALRLADQPVRTAGEIIRYLSGPTVADLAAMPEQGESHLALRTRALRRRLRI